MDGVKLQNMLNEYRNLPYPEIKNIYQNHAYANLLYDDLSGELGELSAVTQYVYEHLNIQTEDILSNVLLGIAIQEMKHLNLVGDLIRKMGNKPYLISSKGTYWSSSNIKYQDMALKDLMNYNIKTEEIAIAGYRKAIQKTRNLEIRKLWDRIIKDEKNHIKIFQEIISELDSECVNEKKT